VYIKVDEWNGDKIIHYPCCTLYNGTIVYCITCKENNKLITKKVFDRKYLSINAVTLENEITESDWENIINDI
jgi:hypothetical protein